MYIKIKKFLKEEMEFNSPEYREMVLRRFNKDKRDLTFDENKKITSKSGKIYVGYWASDNIWYGRPVPNWEGWNDKELYTTFIDNLRKKLQRSEEENYRGWSDCRICGKKNGESEYIIDNKYIVPEGYLHYIINHKIQPHKWFFDYIISS